MHGAVHQQLRLGDRDADRVDQKRHVIGDDVDNGVARIPAVVFMRGIEHAHSRNTRLAHAHELQQAHQQRNPVLDRSRGKIIGTDPAEEMSGKALCLRALRTAKTLFQLLQYKIDDGRRGIDMGVHENPVWG